ncbi:HNH endonuclease, partial [Halorubrum sp. SP9]
TSTSRCTSQMDNQNGDTEMTSEKPYKDQQKLESLLEKHEYHVPSVADECGVSRGTIHRWCEKHGINPKPYSDKEKLKELYVDKGLSAEEVGNRLCGSEHSVLDWLRRHDLPVRTASADRPPHFRTQHGYEKWSVTHQGSSFDVMVHRLLAVAEHGLDELREKDVHHKNRIPWDNRTQNIELLTTEEHMRDHLSTWDRDDDGRILPHQ